MRVWPILVLACPSCLHWNVSPCGWPCVSFWSHTIFQVSKSQTLSGYFQALQPTGQPRWIAEKVAYWFFQDHQGKTHLCNDYRRWPKRTSSAFCLLFDKLRTFWAACSDSVISWDLDLQLSGLWAHNTSATASAFPSELSEPNLYPPDRTVSHPGIKYTIISLCCSYATLPSKYIRRILHLLPC